MLACSISDKLVGSACVCSKEITGDLVESLAGGQRRLGGPKTIKCDPPGTGYVRENRAGFSIDKGTPAADGDLLGQFLIWPASRARDAVLWNTKPTVDVAALTRRAAELSNGLTYSSNEGAPASYVLAGASDVRGALSADIDGDDQPDAIYSIALPSDMERFWQPRFLIASVSSRPGELLEVGASTYSEIQAVAAIDLDGDGADEVLVTEPYHECSSSFVGRFTGGKLGPELHGLRSRPGHYRPEIARNEEPRIVGR